MAGDFILRIGAIYGARKRSTCHSERCEQSVCLAQTLQYGFFTAFRMKVRSGFILQGIYEMLLGITQEFLNSRTIALIRKVVEADYYDLFDSGILSEEGCDLAHCNEGCTLHRKPVCSCAD